MQSSNKKESENLVIEPMNLESLREITNNNREVGHNLLRLFMDSAEKSIGVMENSMEDEKHKLWRDAAHNIKGSAFSVTARKLGEISGEAESAQIEEKKRAALVKVRQEYALVKECIMKELNSNGCV